MAYFFTSESVSEGHPDKVADQISDALLDEFLKKDSTSKVACETLVTTGLVVLSGEVRCSGYVDAQDIARKVIKDIGYTKGEYMFESNSCGVISTIHDQSNDINQGVEREIPEQQGAGDQGMMFGYACSETDDFMPLPLILAHQLVSELADIRRENKVMKYLRPDSKSQVTIKFDEKNNPIAIDTIVVSTQHDEFGDEEKMLETIKKDVQDILIPRVINKQTRQNIKDLFKDYKLFVNPTGKFVIGGPHGDTGLTGRKIIVDTYGGKGAHGGGAFSGKDPSKVDRSAAYAMRHIAKNMVASGLCNEVLVQVAYAIGVAEPVGLYVNTYNSAKVKNQEGNIMNDGEIAEKIKEIFDLRPYSIIERLGLKNPIYYPTAKYGHFGRTPYKSIVKVMENGKEIEKQVEFYTWERLDYIDKIRNAFSIK
ncbi:MAG: methionine adenosyltransferase [Bacteroidales bacterium]|jgi:S-adenosylmethionine synthetase|nr:methionine adenosyltransferase [Bacteroidales bacterium]